MRLKRIAVIVMCFALSILGLYTTSYALATAPAAFTMQSSVTGNIKPENVFYVIVKVEKQVEIAGFYAELQYDSTAFSAAEVSFNNTAMSGKTDVGLSTAGKIIIAWDSSDNSIVKQGDFMKIQFVVLPDVSSNEYTFTLTGFEIYNEKFENLKPQSDVKCKVKVDTQQINENINNVISLIDQIGIVDGTNSSYVSIHSALDAFNALSNEEKKLVSNYNALTQALNDYEIKREELLQKEHDNELSQQLLNLHNKWKPLFDTDGIVNNNISTLFTYKEFLKAQLPFDPATQAIPEDWQPKYAASMAAYETKLGYTVDSVKAAIGEYNAQSVYIKSKLITEKTSLDTAFTALKKAQSELAVYKQQLKNAPQAIKDYIANNNAAIKFEISNLKLDETEAIPNMLLSAIGDYKTLSTIAQSQLENQNRHICELYDAYLALESEANPNEKQSILAAGEFRKKYADLLMLGASEVKNENLSQINTAISDFNALPVSVKGRLTSQFKLLCNQLFQLTSIRAELDTDGQVVYITQDGETKTEIQYVEADTESQIKDTKTDKQQKPASVRISDIKSGRTVYILLIFITFEAVALASSAAFYYYLLKNKKKGVCLQDENEI